MNEKQLQSAKIAKVLHYYFSTGAALNVMAKKFNINEMTISNMISNFMRTFKKEENKAPSTEKTIEEVLLDKKLVSDQRFYEFTKLDPSNRWWVGKGKNN